MKKAREMSDVAGLGELARRYFAINAFDAVLTALGIIVASFLIGADRVIVVAACIGAAIAGTVSGFYGSYLTEQAERTGKIKKLERKVGISLKRTPITKAHRFATLMLALIDGLTALFITLAIIIPFFLSIALSAAYYSSFAVCAVLLFFVGLFLGKISKENLFRAGLKMLLAGLVCAAIILAVEKLRAGI